MSEMQSNNNPVEVLEACLLELSKTKTAITATQNHLRRIIAQLKVKESGVAVHDHLGESALDDAMMRELRETVTEAIETE